MGIETDVTPYGSEVTIFNPYASSSSGGGGGGISDPPVFSPFRPVGQVASAIDPTPLPLSEGPPASYPCLSEYYEPQVLASGLANTIVPPASDKVCGFAQLPPQINQPARRRLSCPSTRPTSLRRR
jgi:hypothetical protein